LSKRLPIIDLSTIAKAAERASPNESKKRDSVLSTR
jgi:hypothetical protein